MAFTDTPINSYNYPEDQGSGVAAGSEDWDNSGHEGGLALAETSNYIQQGLNLNVDFGTSAFNLSQGLAFIEDTTTLDFRTPSDNENSLSGSWPFGRLVVLGVFAKSNIGLQTSSGINHVYLAFNSTGQDDSFIRVTDTTADAPDPGLRIAVIDAANNTVRETNRITGLNWTFDGIEQVSAASELTYTLNDSYDEVRVRLTDIHGDNTSRTILGARVNGVQSSYAFRNTQGNASGSSQWQMAHNRPDTSEITGEIYLAGRWNREVSMDNRTAGNDGKQFAFAGNNTSAVSPLDSVTLFWTSGSITGTIEIWGRDKSV